MWVEIESRRFVPPRPQSHASHEACELKLPNRPLLFCLFPVTPRMRRVSWNINVKIIARHAFVTPRMRRVSWNKQIGWSGIIGFWSRLAWGVWVEIPPLLYHTFGYLCHASHEACELKFVIRAVWATARKSRLAWGVWVEIILFYCFRIIILSRLAWGVWVEIHYGFFRKVSRRVTPRMRRVSWNM